MKTAETQTRIITGKAAVIDKPGAKLSMSQRQYALKDENSVILKIEACGVCHSDSFSFSDQFPGIVHPCVPGHEIVGTVEAAGARVNRLKLGDRVGVGWHGGHCGICHSCRSGDFITCKQLQTPGLGINGGYAEYACFPEAVCAMVPSEISSAEAGPLMCAGVTTFNALRHSGAVGGDVVAILGLGGLGHLGVQFANKMGFNTVAIARGDEKAEFAKKLGAAHYINSQKQNVSEELSKLGGARVVLATATDTKSMADCVGGLGVDGKLLIVGAGMEPIGIAPVQLLGARKTIAGWPSGTALDSEECLNFAAQTGIRPMIERYSFDQAQEAFERMMSGKARFRVVLEIGSK